VNITKSVEIEYLDFVAKSRSLHVLTFYIFMPMAKGLPMHIIRRLILDKSGNFGVLTALLALPLVAAAGATIDYSYAMNLRASLAGAADAAALAVISEGSTGQAAAVATNNEGRVTVAENLSRDIFISNVANYLTLAEGDVDTEVKKSGDTVSSSITFTARAQTMFLHLVGVTHLPITGTAKASLALEKPIYADYHFLLDNSPSMGIGAKQKDIDALVAAVKAAKGGSGCAFACHEVHSNGKAKKNSNYDIARANDITLRIDELRHAVLETLDRASAIHHGASDRARFSAFAFGKNVLNGQYKIQPLASLTSDIASFRKSVEMVSLMETFNSGHNKDALTSIDNALTQVGDTIKLPGGDGTSTNSREQIVLMVTDGVGNSLKPKDCTGVRDGNTPDRCFEPVDLTYCEALKKRGIKIAVMYTTYYAINDFLYNQYVKKFADQIGQTLKQCASLSLYAEVTIKEDMSAIMQKLFEKATGAKKLRLTQ
jgi:Flp pilus assembly protein TadG